MKNNILYHTGFWVLFWTMPVILKQYMITSDKELMPFDAIIQNVTALVSTSTLVSYLNYHCLYSYYDKKKYLFYFIYIFTISCIAAYICNMFLIYQDNNPNSYRIRHIISTIASVFMSTLFWFAQKGYVKELEFKEAKTKRVEAEMGLLKMQIQPHFLFNTLNNVYATNLQNPSQANEMILQLADLLRYQLEITKQEKITLQEEIRLTESYIALEEIRLHNCEVLVEKKGDFEAYSITPLLFLPLVENAFKYSTDIQKSRIHISFELQNNQLIFLCHNTIGQKKQVASNKMGLENVRKRLELLYPQQHELTLKEIDHNFILTLNICL